LPFLSFFPIVLTGNFKVSEGFEGVYNIALGKLIRFKYDLMDNQYVLEFIILYLIIFLFLLVFWVFHYIQYTI